MRIEANRELKDPLSRRAVGILHEGVELHDDSDLVHASPRRMPLSDMTLSKLLMEQYIAATPHGFRSESRRFEDSMETDGMES